jgi:ribonuclease D
LGYRFPIGLSDIAPLIIGKEVSKGETLTDWSFRPLKIKQIEYAAQDALILLPLYTELLRRLQEEGKEELCWLASNDLVQESLKVRDVRTDWLHWGLAEILSIKSQRVITRLLEWREDLSERKNKPSNYILPKASLIYLSKQHPTHVEQIQNRKINRIFLKKYGTNVVKIIREALQSTETFSIPSGADKERMDFLNLWVKVFAKKLSIAPKLLLPPTLIRFIVLEGITTLQGWRRKLCLEALQRVLEGSETIILQDGQLVLIELPATPVPE